MAVDRPVLEAQNQRVSGRKKSEMVNRKVEVFAVGIERQIIGMSGAPTCGDSDDAGGDIPELCRGAFECVGEPVDDGVIAAAAHSGDDKCAADGRSANGDLEFVERRGVRGAGGVVGGSGICQCRGVMSDRLQGGTVAPMPRDADRSLIFVQIAAYCDRDLANTIRSALDEAVQPDRLRFGICHQYDAATSADLDGWSGDRRFRIDRLPASESRGVGWARSRTQELWSGEQYTLQIDAHMRFAPAWDSRCIDMLASIDCDRPMITNYPPWFRMEPDGTELREQPESPRRLGLVPNTPKINFRLRSEPVPITDRPGRHPYLAAGHFFTVGRFCRDVPYDPDVYFIGEEISLAARAYTHGYDLHYPNETVIWHWYHHPSRLHWDDHRDHGVRDEVARRRLQRLLRGDDRGFGRLGLGRRRSLEGFGCRVGDSLASFGDVRV